MYKNKMKIIIDILMTLILLIQMSYELFGIFLSDLLSKIGITFDGYEYAGIIHEYLGIALIILFCIHFYLNRWWIKSIFKGKYNFSRTILTFINFALIFDVIILFLSGIGVSKSIVIFDTEEYISLSREAHMLSAYWGFVLMSFHAGMNWQMISARIFHGKKYKILTLIALFIMIYGAYAFNQRQLWEYMTLKNMFVFFDYDENYLCFLLDYLSIMLLFACLGHYLNSTMKRFKL